MFGTGKLQLTGQLGDVMKETAQAALSYVRTNAERYGIAEGLPREERPAHPHPGGRDAQGRPERRRDDVHGARVAAHRASASVTTSR